MLRRFFLCFATVALALLAPRSARAQTALIVTGGIAAPVSALSDFSNMGYNVGVGLGIALPTLPIGLRFEAAYNSFGYQGGGGNTYIVTGTGNVVFNISTTNDSPYLIGGFGVYTRGFSATRTGFQDNRTTVGLNGGGGLRFPLSGITTFFEARYHIMLGEGNQGLNYQFIPITFGIAF